MTKILCEWSHYPGWFLGGQQGRRSDWIECLQGLPLLWWCCLSACLLCRLRRGGSGFGPTVLSVSVSYSLADHFGGKLHLGFVAIREKITELEASSLAVVYVLNSGVASV